MALSLAILSSLARANEPRKPPVSSHATARLARIALYVEQFDGFSARIAALNAAAPKYKATGRPSDSATASGRIGLKADAIYLRDELVEVLSAAPSDAVLRLDGDCHAGLTAAVARLLTSMHSLERYLRPAGWAEAIVSTGALNERLARCRARMIK